MAPNGSFIDPSTIDPGGAAEVIEQDIAVVLGQRARFLEQNNHRSNADPRRGRRSLETPVGLDAAPGDDGVGTPCHRIRHDVLELAALVAAKGEPGQIVRSTPPGTTGGRSICCSGVGA
jgi:hypothetical protein